jgi:RHS repeat-associated protein
VQSLERPQLTDEASRRPGRRIALCRPAQPLVGERRDGDGAAILSYDYDTAGRVSSVTDALNQVTTYRYDPGGNLIAKADPGGTCPTSGAATACTRYSYDAADQLTIITHSDGTTPNVAYTYGPAGQRATMADGSGTTSYGYDSLGRLTAVTDGAGATVGYTYDLRGLLTGIAYPGLGTVTRSWDDASRIDAVTDWAGRTFDYTLDPNGNPTDIAYPAGSGTTDNFAYDHANHLTASSTSAAGTTLAALTYGRGPGGELTADTQTGLPGGDHTYGYTALDQLCYAAPASSGTGSCTTPPSGATSYAYDAADNLTSTATAATQHFDPAHQLCWTAPAASTNACTALPTGATSYNYDARGNRIGATTPAGSTSYTYDQANRLTAVGTTWSYTHNGDGLRTAKTGPAGTTAFTWDMAETLPTILRDGGTAYVYGPDGLPLEQVDSTGNAVYYHHDQLGSTRLLTDPAGSVVGTESYDPYGTPITTGTTTPLGYTGQYTDSESGLIYLRARYYDPTTGQWMSRDPVVDVTLEPYGYVGGDPMNLVDPSGLSSCGFSIGGFVDCASKVGKGAANVGARTGATLAQLSPVGQALDLVSHGTGMTVGGCVSGTVLSGVELDASICYASTPSGQAGFTAGAGAGMGFPVGGSFLVGPTVSNAHNLGDLGGPFGYLWASGGAGPLSAGGSMQAGKNSCGSVIWQATPGWAPGLATPTPFGYGSGLNWALTAPGW